MIPQSFIHELVARANLLDVIGARVTLKKAGANYKGLCPFHNEKTPSFSVSPDKGFYHCFGCGVHGNAIDFVMRYENRSFLEAVEALADMLHLEVPRDGRAEPENEFEGLYAQLREAEQIYRRALREHDAAVDYLKRRGIDGNTAARFALGYAPAGWQGLAAVFPNYADRLLADAGLVIQGEEGKRYDRFRDRIMFPIVSQRGQVIGDARAPVGAQPRGVDERAVRRGLGQVLSGGRGEGLRQAVDVVEQIADGIVGARRGSVELFVLDVPHQIGQSLGGRAEIYRAHGVSCIGSSVDTTTAPISPTHRCRSPAGRREAIGRVRPSSKGEQWPAGP